MQRNRAACITRDATRPGCARVTAVLSAVGTRTVSAPRRAMKGRGTTAIRPFGEQHAKRGMHVQTRALAHRSCGRPSSSTPCSRARQHQWLTSLVGAAPVKRNARLSLAACLRDTSPSTARSSPEEERQHAPRRSSPHWMRRAESGNAQQRDAGHLHWRSTYAPGHGPPHGSRGHATARARGTSSAGRRATAETVDAVRSRKRRPERRIGQTSCPKP